MVGQTLLHYKIVGVLGEGGMGKVYLAEDQKLNREVALKILPAELMESAERRQRFEREAKTVAALNHPNIVTIHAVEQADDRAFIAMERVAGQSLSETIPDEGLTLKRFFQLAVPLVDAISAAHRQGITHRDLKPDNVMVTGDDLVKVLDFGLAKQVEGPFQQSKHSSDSQAPTASITQDGRIIGTVAYMSPEQAQGKPVDVRSDIFSLGIMLYEMSTGKRPFEGDSSISIISSIIKDSPASITDLNRRMPRALARIVQRCLAKSPEERYQGASELRDELDAVRQQADSGALGRVFLTGPSRRPGWLSVAAVVLTVAAIAFAAFFVFPRLGDGGAQAAVGIGASGRPAVAVINFQDHSAVPELSWLSSGLPSMLLTGLAQSTDLDIVSSQRMYEVANQLGQDIEAIEQSAIGQVARQAGAGAVVVGNVYKAGEDVRIDVRVEDVNDGRLMFAHSVTGPDVFALVDDLTLQIQSGLSLQTTAAPGIASVTTDSLEAYRFYSEGLEAQRNLRTKDARSLFTKAVAIDPAFAMAHFQLSGLVEGDMAGDHFKTVMRHIDRLPERDRLLVQAVNAMDADHDHETGERFLNDLLGKYPDAEDAYMRLSRIHLRRGDFDASLQTLKRGVTAVPRSGSLRNQYGYRLFAHGQYDEALEQIETYAELAPNEPNPYDSLGELHMRLGRPEEAIAYYSTAIEKNSSFIASHHGRMHCYGILGRYDEMIAATHKLAEVALTYNENRAVGPYIRAFLYSRIGRVKEAREELDYAARVAAESSNQEDDGLIMLLRAFLSVERGDLKTASELLLAIQQGLDAIPNQTAKSDMLTGARLVSGVLLAESGRPDAARMNLEAVGDMSQVSNYWMKSWKGMVEAEILLAEGKAAEAVSVSPFPSEAGNEMTIGDYFGYPYILNFPTRDIRARALAANGQIDDAIEAYRGLTDPDRRGTAAAILEPQHVLALARLLKKNGQDDEANVEYSRFLQLWKDADEGLPELAEAHAALDDA